MGVALSQAFCSKYAWMTDCLAAWLGGMDTGDKGAKTFGETQQLGTAGGETGGEIDEVGKI